MRELSKDKGMHGQTATLTGLEVLKSLEKLHCSGTLIFEDDAGILFLQLAKGQLEASFKLGRFDSLESSGLAFHFEPHEPKEMPRVKSRYPLSSLSTIRALPNFGAFLPLPSKVIDLRILLGQLHSDEFTGLLCFEGKLETGSVILYEGHLGAAFYEEDDYIREGIDALRALRRSHLHGATLHLRPLHKHLILCLLGIAHKEEDEETTSFSGLESSEAGYTYYYQNQAILHVEAELRGRSGRYTPYEPTESLPFPDEPPGWEHNRYKLTLRGQDALKPITDQSMHFQASFGKSGKRILEQLEQGMTLENVSQYLELELSELKPWLDKLENEGFIRHLQD